MSQATQTRAPAASRWSLRPPQVRLSRSTVGAVLALSAWLLQSYVTSLDASRIELRDALRTAESQREMWMIEYNSSLIRQPRSERVTARAALEVVESTREFLAFSVIVERGLFAMPAPSLDAAGEDILRVRTLFEERNYRDLVVELETVNSAFEEHRTAHAAGSEPEIAMVGAGFVWWRHAFPLAFLLGIGLCVTGGRRHGARDV